MQCTSHVSVANAKLPRGAESNIFPHLPWQHSCLLANSTRTLSPLTHHFFSNLESTIWNWSYWRTTCSERKSPIWHIESQRMECDPVIQIWKQLQSVHHLKLTPRCMPFLGWWAITEGSLRGLHTFHRHSANIWLEKGPAGSWSRCHFEKMPWRLLKLWNRHASQLLFWLLLITLSCSCWRLMCWRRD